MLKKIAMVAGALWLATAATSAAQAATYKAEFLISGFGPVEFGIGPAPFQEAYGTAIFSAASLNADWDHLQQFSLTIGDASYTMADAEMVNYSFGASIGGIVNTSAVLQPEANDFFVLFDPERQGVTVTYSSATGPGYWYGGSSSVTFTELAVAPVPELQTGAMLLAGLAMVGALSRRRRTAIFRSVVQ